MPDRAVRRLVAELAQVAPADVRGVLNRLDPVHRDEIQALLAAYDGEPVEAVQASREETIETVGLSPWLEARARSGGADPTFAMTEAASTALRACAPAPDRVARTAGPPRSPSPPRGLDVLMGRLRKRP